MVTGVGPVRRAAFLDRDGVLTRAFVRGGKPYPPRTLEEFDLLPGTADAVARLRDHGWLAIVVTNQPDLAAGTLTAAALAAIHARLAALVPVDAIVVCPHPSDAGCRCHKPQPGMLLDAAARFGIDLARSVMVGDRWRDVGAGRNAGCTSILIDRGYQEDGRGYVPDRTVADLPAAVRLILEGEAP